MSDRPNSIIHFPNLPLWKGVRPDSSLSETFPLSLGLDEKGYIRQTTPDEIQKRIVQCYADDKYSLPSTPPGASSWGDARGEAVIKAISNTYGDLNGARILDIGGGSTYLAKRMVKDLGAARCTVMDPSVTEIPDSDKIEVRRDYFTLDSCPDEEFDLVLSVNCLEHIPDPAGFLRGVRRAISKSKGRALLMFPDTEAGFANGDLNIILHEHINYFTSASVENLTNGCGLSILSCETKDDAFCCLLEAGAETKTEAAGDQSLQLGAKAFEKALDHFRNMVLRLSTHDRSLAFHGATNGLNNLLSLSGIRETGLPGGVHIFDGDENKTGKFLTGCPLAVRHSSDPDYGNYEHVIISAMTFYQPIRNFLVSRLGFSKDRIHPLFPIENEMMGDRIHE